MKYLFSIFIFSFCLLSAQPEKDLDQLDQELALETPPKTELLFQRAFIYLSLEKTSEALTDLKTIISRPPDDMHVYIEALWMHLAISAALRDLPTVLMDLESLKQWDENFPLIYLDKKTLYIREKNPSNKKMKACLGYLGAVNLLEDLQAIKCVSTLENEAPSPHILITFAVVCAFSNSPWCQASCGYIGKLLAPQVEWTSENFDLQKSLLKRIAH